MGMLFSQTHKLTQLTNGDTQLDTVPTHQQIKALDHVCHTQGNSFQAKLNILNNSNNRNTFNHHQFNQTITSSINKQLQLQQLPTLRFRDTTMLLLNTQLSDQHRPAHQFHTQIQLHHIQSIQLPLPLLPIQSIQLPLLLQLLILIPLLHIQPIQPIPPLQSFINSHCCRHLQEREHCLSQQLLHLHPHHFLQLHWDLLPAI